MGHPVGGTIPSGGSGSGAKSRLWELTFISDSLGLRGLPAKPFFYSVAMTRNDSRTVAGPRGKHLGLIGVCFDGHQQIKPNEVPKRQESIVVRDDGYNSRRARQIKSRRVHPSALSEIDFHFVPLGDIHKVRPR